MPVVVERLELYQLNLLLNLLDFCGSGMHTNSHKPTLS
jgi:hypothetical protein